MRAGYMDREAERARRDREAELSRPMSPKACLCLLLVMAAAVLLTVGVMRYGRVAGWW
jgi:hypothetical protein